ncbi:hypothetical protein C9374_008910 [Naegleria lovaniensis]|uniref:Dynactin subunit 4 n=1 Tax=Naegleria lovaniensis TaxID=51637 RepID=A0AA88GJA1_NAELO|nr:uncharacterized protein C9374_008910 [Naegleria lovaniensis]KAG2377825.1 hypothetical protein C9374_008910 [Naegleria lovaniensis]
MKSGSPTSTTIQQPDVKFNKTSCLLFEPNVLFFPMPNKYKTILTLHIFNNHLTEFVAFSIKNPNPQYFKFSKMSAVLLPKTSTCIEITLECFHSWTIGESNGNVVEFHYKQSDDPQDFTKKGSLTRNTHIEKLEYKISFPSNDNLSVKILNDTITIAPKKVHFDGIRDHEVKYISLLYGCEENCPVPVWDLFMEPTEFVLISRNQLQEEIQSYYCPSCLMEVSGSEAMSNRMTCSYCYECPQCNSNLTIVSSENGTYFDCPFCHWNSLSIGLNTEGKYSQLFDQLKDHDFIHQNKFYILSKAFAELCHSSQFELSKTSNSVMASNKNLPIISIDEFLNERHDEEYDRLSPTSFNYTSFISFPNRLLHPSCNEIHSEHVWPFRKTLCTKKIKKYGNTVIVKRSADSNSSFGHFEINHSAMFYLPKVSIVNAPVMFLNHESDLYLNITNPHENFKLSLTFSQNLNYSKTNAKLILSDRPIILREHFGLDLYSHDTMVFIQGNEEEYRLRSEDDTSFVLERRGNQVKVRLGIIPQQAGPVQCSLCVKMSIIPNEMSSSTDSDSGFNDNAIRHSEKSTLFYIFLTLPSSSLEKAPVEDEPIPVDYSRMIFY